MLHSITLQIILRITLNRSRIMISEIRYLSLLSDYEINITPIIERLSPCFVAFQRTHARVVDSLAPDLSTDKRGVLHYACQST